MLRNICARAIFVAVLAGSLHAAEVPRRSPEFAVALPNGKQILISEQRGKVMALLFILTYCAHCQDTVKALSTLQKEYGPRGFQVVATAIEPMAKTMVPDFVKRFEPAFPVGFNEREQALSYLQHPSNFRLLMPQLVFIDRTGTIRAQYTGDDPFFGADQEKNLREKIESLLKSGDVKTRKAKGGARK
ncbi:MAG TPA: TlpA disulfide reductase family protein [Bryobacteraceae bacterium]|nr:TlpA disulfide reductase family protein [Bryobacteraceae bacterium]